MDEQTKVYSDGEVCKHMYLFYWADEDWHK